MRVAIIHYWLVGMRGGEAVLEALLDIFPDADIYTHVYDPDAVSSAIRARNVKTTFIGKLPWAKKLYKNYLPLMPLALENLDLRGYDLVISSESGPAKGVLVPSEARHICYCHTPMRYIWDMYHEHLAMVPFLLRPVMRLIAHYLRMWDVSTAARVDAFAANSCNVANRIRRWYGRTDARVITPPADVEAHTWSRPREEFYLVVGQLVGYKKTDVAVRAFNGSGKKLVVIGGGEDLEKLRKMARPNVNLMGRQPRDILLDHMAHCRALVFPGVEDFGLVPVEAMASGAPVIALKKGGSLETVLDGKTGILYEQDSPEGLMQAVEKFEREGVAFDAQAIADHAKGFNRATFKQQFSELVHDVLSESCEKIPNDAK